MIPDSSRTPAPQAQIEHHMVRMYDSTIEYVPDHRCKAVDLGVSLLEHLSRSTLFRAEKSKAKRLRFARETEDFLKAALLAEA